MLNYVSLLYHLFPGISDYKSIMLPTWADEDRPWEILSLGENGLTAQIRRLFEGGVFIHPEAEIGDFVEIEGPCYVGANAEIRHSAFLRKGSWISEGAVVGHSSEVKNSILLPNSKAPHFNYVGDSILGMGVNIGAGVKLSNVRNDRREVSVVLRTGERVFTGLRKLGALIGDESQLGCNVVTNPGVMIAPSSMIAPNETISGWFETRS